MSGIGQHVVCCSLYLPYCCTSRTCCSLRKRPHPCQLQHAAAAVTAAAALSDHIVQLPAHRRKSSGLKGHFSGHLGSCSTCSSSRPHSTCCHVSTQALEERDVRRSCCCSYNQHVRVDEVPFRARTCCRAAAADAVHCGRLLCWQAGRDSAVLLSKAK